MAVGGDAARLREVLRRHIFACVMLMLTTIYWVVWLIVTPDPFNAIGAVLIGTGLLLAATAAIAGMLVEHSRLAYRMGWGLLGCICVVALLRPLMPAWFVAISIAGFSGLLMANPTLDGWIRSEPPVAPVPRSAVAVALLLLATPTASAVAGAGREVGILPLLALICWLILYCYVRRLPGAVILLRAGLPALVVAGCWLPFLPRLVWMLSMTTASVLAWRSSTRLAVRPLIERGSSIPIPPELAPNGIRRAIDIDRSGQ